MSRPLKILYSNNKHPFSFFLSLNLKSCKYIWIENLNQIYREIILAMPLISFHYAPSFSLCIELIHK